jgi:membrane protease YdiL (CAAX protease family)
VFAEPPELTAPPFEAGLPRIWRSRDVLVGLAMIIGAFALIAGGLGIYIAATGDRDGDGPGIVSTLAFELLIGGSVLLLAAHRGVSLHALGFRRPRRWAPLGIVWTGSYGVLVVYTIILSLIESAGVDTSRFSGGNPLPIEHDNIVLLVILGVAVVVVAPVSEELFFRGLIFRGLRGYWRLLPALLVSGALFAAFHGNLSVLVPFTFIGAFFAWGFEESDSLWTSILAHALVNGLSFALSVAGVGN